MAAWMKPAYPVIALLSLGLTSCGGGGGSSGTSGSPSAGGGSTAPIKCTICTNLNTELRPLTPGDRWLYSITTTSATPSPVGPAKTLDRSVSAGPTYSSTGRSLATTRLTTNLLANDKVEETSFIDFAAVANDRRYRIVALDGFVVNSTAFVNDNLPVFFLSPLGVGLSWTYQTDFIGPPSAGSGSSNQLERYTYQAQVIAVERIQTPAGTFDTWKIRYQIVCRRGFTSSAATTPINLACTDEYLGEQGNYWVYPNVGIIQNEGVADYGFGSGSAFLGDRITFSIKLNSANFSYN